MPTLEHNGLVDLFRENPSLAPHLIQTLFHVELPLYATVAVVEASLDQLIPIEFRADLVLELCDEKGALVLSILSAVAHGNGPDGLAVVLAALGTLGRLDQEHAAVTSSTMRCVSPCKGPWRH